MSSVGRGRRKRIALGAAVLCFVARSLHFAGEPVEQHPTPNEIREAYVGATYSRLPDHYYSGAIVHLGTPGDAYGVSHVEDRGVEMLWLETAQLPSKSNDHPLFSVVDVLVLPKGYKADGLVVTICRSDLGGLGVAALTDEGTTHVRRVWGIDFVNRKFKELQPVTDRCTMTPGDD